jgi:hypothetical protein
MSECLPARVLAGSQANPGPQYAASRVVPAVGEADRSGRPGACRSTSGAVFPPPGRWPLRRGHGRHLIDIPDIYASIEDAAEITDRVRRVAAASRSGITWIAHAEEFRDGGRVGYTGLDVMG